MSYILQRLLLTSKKRPEMREDPESSPGNKTPLSMELTVPEKMENIVVSTTKGGLELIEEHKDTEAKSNFFKLPPQKEDDLLFNLTNFLYIEGAKRDWGGVALRESINEDYLNSVEKYFEDYGLDIYQIFSGKKGISSLNESGRFSSPDQEEESFDHLTDSLLEDWMENYLHAGTYKSEIPILYLPLLEEYVVFTASPQFIGQMNRVGNFINIAIHNPVYGLVITKFEENEEEKDVSR